MKKEEALEVLAKTFRTENDYKILAEEIEGITLDNFDSLDIELDEDLIDIMYLKEIVVQVAFERDEHGREKYVVNIYSPNNMYPHQICYDYPDDVNSEEILDCLIDALSHLNYKNFED